MLNLNEKDETYNFDLSMSQLLTKVDGINYVALGATPMKSKTSKCQLVSVLIKTLIVNDVACSATECRIITEDTLSSEQFIRYFNFI